MTKPQRLIIISDDIPEAYLRWLLGHRIDSDASVFSCADALRQAEGERRRSQDHKHHPHGRPPRGRAARIGEPK